MRLDEFLLFQRICFVMFLKYIGLIRHCEQEKIFLNLTYCWESSKIIIGKFDKCSIYVFWVGQSPIQLSKPGISGSGITVAETLVPVNSSIDSSFLSQSQAVLCVLSFVCTTPFQVKYREIQYKLREFKVLMFDNI